jgi:hypothetical protein
LDSADEFSEFAGASAPRLYRTAFLLCGDWHTAQDLAQTTLAKVFVSWRRIQRQDGAHAYAHRTLVNSYLAMARTRSSTETPVSILPEGGVSGQTRRELGGTRCPQRPGGWSNSLVGIAERLRNSPRSSGESGGWGRGRNLLESQPQAGEQPVLVRLHSVRPGRAEARKAAYSGITPHQWRSLDR